MIVRTSVGALAALLAIAAPTAPAAGTAKPGIGVTYLAAGPTVEIVPVVLQAAALPDFDGALISHVGLARWNASSAAFEPIPFQIDERVDHVFVPGTSYEFTQNIHDVFHEEDGTLDADDEVVFMYRDAGPEAPDEAPWPLGAGPERYTLELTDPSGEVQEPRYVYVFTGDGLPGASERLVDWQIARTTAVDTESYSVDYLDRWLLTGLHVFEPCGDGGDLIDRVKGRAGLAVTQAETEEVWNLSATFMGGLVGPVRAVRYVKGAASGVNTIHYDLVYPEFWERHIDLRVHPLDNIWFYLDWLPGRVERTFTPNDPSGIAVDGVPDSGVDTEVVPWELVRGPNGGLAVVYDMPDSPFIGSRERYWRDDATFNDATVYPPIYDDDDDSAIGNHGVKLHAVTGSELDDIPVRIRMYPLCRNVGDVAAGEAYARLWSEPPVVAASPQWSEIAPVRDLGVVRVDDDVALGWRDNAAAAAYRVYASDDPSLPQESWTLLQETTENDFVDAGGALGPPRYYSVVVVDGNGEEHR